MIGRRSTEREIESKWHCIYARAAHTELKLSWGCRGKSLPAQVVHIVQFAMHVEDICSRLGL